MDVSKLIGDTQIVASIAIRHKKTGEIIHEYRHYTPDEASGACLPEPVLLRHALEYCAVNGISLSYADLRGVDASDLNLRGLKMLYANLAEADFSGACLPGASLMGADLTQVNFSHADLSFACLNDAKLPRAQMFRTILTDTQMAFTDCSHARLDTLRSRNASFYGAVFDHAVFHEVTLRKARLERTRFRNAKTEGLHISDCTVEKCDFTGTSLAATYPLPPSLFKKAGDWVQSNISGLATFAAGAMLGALLVAPGRSPALAKDASQTAASLPKDQLADFADDAPAWPDVALAQEPFADEDPGLDPATARYLWRFEALVDDHTPGARIEMASYQNEKNCLAGQPCLVRLFTKNAQGVKQEMLGACTSDMSECVMLMEKSAAPAP